MIDRRDGIATGGVRIEGRVDTDHLARVLDARRLVEEYGAPEGSSPAWIAREVPP
jgi:hypothetical protein